MDSLKVINIEKVIESLSLQASNYLPKLALALIVLVIGLFIINRVIKGINFALDKKQLDPSLSGFLSGLTGWLLKALLFISVASMVGITTTSFVALLGAAGLAVGMALQGNLANFAGGILILIFKPFKTGDYISAQGEEGLVQKIDVFATILTKRDNRKVILPNGPLASGTIVNYTAEPVRRVDIGIGIGYNDSIPKAIEALKNMALKNPKVLKDPEVFVGVTEYADSSINLRLQAWCKTPDFVATQFELNEAVKACLDDAKISIPFPQRDVHIYNHHA